MKKTIGIFAHVDAGKTTFSEQLLYNNGAIRQRGRVDDKNTVMDTDEVEKQRGITVFSGVSFFEYKNDTFYIIDTPGHSDFFPEARRTMPAIDAAIVLVSACDMVQSHTELIWNNLEKLNIPAFIFVNKTDIAENDRESILNDIKSKLSGRACDFFSDDFAEKIADFDDDFAESYLADSYSYDMLIERAAKAVRSRAVFPVFFGSALQNEGMEEFMEKFHALSIDNEEEGTKSALVYKILNDAKGNRISFVKILGKSFKVKDKLSINGSDETINELRFYRGDRFELMPIASSGDVCAFTGLKNTRAGDIIGDDYIKAQDADTPVLLSRVTSCDGTDISSLLAALRVIEDEEPSLKLIYDSDAGEIQICVNGKIQIEILQTQLFRRFGIDARFEKCTVVYKETIKNPVRGYGHFEPLKHYAEVHLDLRPAKRGTGLSFKSELSTDRLTADKQNLIEQYAIESDHRGVLTCSALTDIEIVLKRGAVHEKHTHGGDLLEAVKRAVRYGLEFAENVLLEPWYRYKISLPTDFIGRLMTDLGTLGASYNPPQTYGDRVEVTGLIPVSEAFWYFDELILYTKGKARINAIFDGYDICHNSDKVIKDIAYDRSADRKNVADSIFCSHGSGYVVPYTEAKAHMHLK